MESRARRDNETCYYHCPHWNRRGQQIVEVNRRLYQIALFLQEIPAPPRDTDLVQHTCLSNRTRAQSVDWNPTTCDNCTEMKFPLRPNAESSTLITKVLRGVACLPIVVATLTLIDAAINQVDSPGVKTNSDSCGSRAGACASLRDRLRRPALRSASAHSRSAECFCQRLQHSHFTTLKVIVCDGLLRSQSQNNRFLDRFRRIGCLSTIHSAER